MTDRELEKALRGALRPRDPGADFGARVLAHLETERRSSRVPASMGRAARRNFYRWSVPAALAASVLAAIGLVHWRTQSATRARGIEARAQLLQALSIAGAQVNGARAAVLRDEGQLE